MTSQLKYQFAKGVKDPKDGYYRPCFVTCEDEVCGDPQCDYDSGRMYRVFNRNPDRFNMPFVDSSNDSYYVPVHTMNVHVSSNATHQKRLHYYMDTHMSPPLVAQDLANAMDAFAPPYESICIRADPCKNELLDYRVCCPSLEPPLLIDDNPCILSDQVKAATTQFATLAEDIHIAPMQDRARTTYAQDALKVDALLDGHIKDLSQKMDTKEADYKAHRNKFIHNTIIVAIFVGLAIVLFGAFIAIRDLILPPAGNAKLGARPSWF